MADLAASTSCGNGRTRWWPGDPDALAAVTEAIDLLDTGEARVAEVDPRTDEVVVHEWLKQAILLLFRLRSIETIEVGPVRVRRQAPAQAALRRVRGPGGPRGLGPLGLLPGPRGRSACPAT